MGFYGTMEGWKIEAQHHIDECSWYEMAIWALGRVLNISYKFSEYQIHLDAVGKCELILSKLQT